MSLLCYNKHSALETTRKTSFNFIIFISLNLILENTTDQYNIAENSPLALVYLNIIKLNIKNEVSKI